MKTTVSIKLIKILLPVFIFSLWLTQKTVAQDLPLVFRDGPAYNLRVMIVPFDPRIYYNDATVMMAQKTGETGHEIMQFFRYEFNRMLNVSLMDSCIVIDLLTDDTRQATRDISDLYTGIGYVMRPAMQNKPEGTHDNRRRGFLRRSSTKNDPAQTNDSHTPQTRLERGQIISERQSKENKFVHIYFTNPDYLREIARRRGIDIFLFINQFEIKGVYETYMSGNPDSKRNFRVHFSMYNGNGEFLHGSYGKTEIPFYLDDKQEVVNRYFPEVIRQIIHNIEFPE